MFSRAHFVVLVLAGCFGWAVSQPVFAAPGEGNGKRAELRQRALQKFDKNGNGQLDPDEKEAAKEAMQTRREQGGGKGQGGRSGIDPERRRKLLGKFDTDGDGKLSESERAAAKAARAKREAQ
jgi:Ca2+-binding EF-hand superfamily protein